MVYVQNKSGKPLMPCTVTKANRLIRAKKARVVIKCPLVIRLNWECEGQVQRVVAAIVPSSKVVGVAAVNIETGQTLYKTSVVLRTDIKKKMDRRRSYRRNRRYRNTRYRACRFDNRKSDRKLNPTLNSKLQTHYKMVSKMEALLPILKWKIQGESKVARVWKVKDEQWLNVQRQTFERDSFKCRQCKGKSKNREIHAHHIQHRADGGKDILENLVTLCKTCHVNYHKGKLTLKIGKHKLHGKINTELSVIRQKLLIKDSIKVYGFVVKSRRLKRKLRATPIANALACIKNVKIYKSNKYKLVCVSTGDYQQTKGSHSQTKIPTGKLLGFRKFDQVLYQGKKYFIKGKRTTGYFELSTISNPVKLRPMPKSKDLVRIRARKSTMEARISSPV